MRALIVIAATAALPACPAAPVARPTPGAPVAGPRVERVVRLRIAQAEARRAGGVDELVALAGRGAPGARGLALRGLGRVGGPAARATLRTALAASEPAVVIAAAQALGVLAQLDEAAPDVDVTRALEAALARAQQAARAPASDASNAAPNDAPVVAVVVALIEALGRAGGPEVQARLASELTAQLTAVPARAEAAALALARHGRRKLALAPAAHGALVDAVVAASAPGGSTAIAYATAYALARAHLSPGAPPHREPALAVRTAAALTALLGHAAPEVRAQACAALARQRLVERAAPALARTLADPEPIVAVEAARALAGDAGTDAGRDQVAGALGGWLTALEGGRADQVHVLTEALRLLAPHARRPRVLAAVLLLAPRVATTAGAPPSLARGWIDCLARVVLVRGAASPELTRLDGCGLPDHLRLPLVTELVAADVGAPVARRALLGRLLAHADPRVRAAALAAVPALWDDVPAGDRRILLTALAGALGSADPIVAGTAAEAAPALYAVLPATSPERAILDAAVLARARTEAEPELAAALLGVIGAQVITAGAEVCRRALGGPPVRARAARVCLGALGEAPPPDADDPVVAAAPPVDVAAVIDADLVWHLVTTRGPIDIALRPDVAPWAVAAIVDLTRRGFYDGLELHRVVPGFVVQGGDPTGSGWGGPGFALPAEPGGEPGFVAGGVGLADAGRDSAGSQWFAMHARAPHLDGRYTWFGAITRGRAAADALVIGDRIERATITRGLASAPTPR